MSAPITDEEKRRQISVRGVASLEGVEDLKAGKILIILILLLGC